MGNQSHPVKPGQQPEANLPRAGETQTSREAEIASDRAAGYQPRNRADRGSRRCPRNRRQHQSAETAWRRGPTGVVDRGAVAQGLHRNLRGPRTSTRENPEGSGRPMPRPACGEHDAKRERTSVLTSGTGARRQIRLQGCRESEDPHGTTMLGNSPQEEPAEE